MDQFDCRRSAVERFIHRAGCCVGTHTGIARCIDQRGPHSFTSTEHGITHRLMQALRHLIGGRQQTLENLLDMLGALSEPTR